MGGKYLLRSTRSGVLWSLYRSHIVHTISYICVVWAFLGVSFQSSANCLTSHANLLNINFIIGHVHMMYVGYVCVAWHAPMEVGGQFYGVSSLPPPVHDGSHRAELRSPCLINKPLPTEPTWGPRVWILLQVFPALTLPPHNQVGFEQRIKGQALWKTFLPRVWPTDVPWLTMG